MNLFSIMPLDTTHIDEICEDIRHQQEDGVSDTALFIMYFAPDGTPPLPKAEIYCRKYDLFREKLDRMGLSHGVLVQSTLGHGPRPVNEHPFKKVESLPDGRLCEICCPLDESYRDYIREQMRILALHKPRYVMIDDDVGILYRGNQGCACAAHRSLFAEIYGTNMTREELSAHVNGVTDEDKRIRDAYIAANEESLALAVTAMREGLDSVDPTIQGIVCTAGTFCEGQPRLAQIFAGKGNPVIARYNNGMYCKPSPKEFSRSMIRAAAQREVLGDDIDVFLAEADTCPQNRYSTSASRLHAHMTGTILEGAKGAKHWITRLGPYEPESGVAYRRILAKYAGFYKTLEEIEPSLKPVGCRIPLSKKRVYPLGVPYYYDPAFSAWSDSVLERFGLPLYFSGKSGGAVFVDDVAPDRFSDEELRSMLSGPVFLSAEAAKRVIARGLGDLIGVDVVPLKDERITREKIFVTGQNIACQKNTQRLVPLSENTQADSMVVTTPAPDTDIPLFPGSTVFKNELGGTAVVFCGTPFAFYNYHEAFSFLCSSRKRQFVRLLKRMNCLPVYYESDEEVYLRAATMPDGRLLCALFNLSFDQTTNCRLVCDRPVSNVERLQADGTWAQCNFHMEGETAVIETPLITLIPEVLALSFLQI